MAHKVVEIVKKIRFLLLSGVACQVRYHSVSKDHMTGQLPSIMCKFGLSLKSNILALNQSEKCYWVILVLFWRIWDLFFTKRVSWMPLWIKTKINISDIYTKLAQKSDLSCDKLPYCELVTAQWKIFSIFLRWFPSDFRFKLLLI